MTAVRVVAVCLSAYRHVAWQHCCSEDNGAACAHVWRREAGAHGHHGGCNQQHHGTPKHRAGACLLSVSAQPAAWWAAPHKRQCWGQGGVQPRVDRLAAASAPRTLGIPAMAATVMVCLACQMVAACNNPQCAVPADVHIHHQTGHGVWRACGLQVSGCLQYAGSSGVAGCLA